LKKSNGDTAAAYEYMKAAKSDKFNMYASYADYLKAFAGKDLLNQPDSLVTYAARFHVPTTKDLPANAAVRTQPAR
ncbi:MAG: hypothetical protein ACKO0Z_15545, partial [Betaproteobacteria bacterium]